MGGLCGVLRKGLIKEQAAEDHGPAAAVSYPSQRAVALSYTRVITSIHSEDGLHTEAYDSRAKNHTTPEIVLRDGRFWKLIHGARS